MIKVNRNTSFAVPNHTQHYTRNGMVVKTQPQRGGGFYVQFAPNGAWGEYDENNVPHYRVPGLVRALLHARTLEEGDSVELWRNQGLREGWVEKITPTRVRFGYEMPNAGTMYGWGKPKRLVLETGETLFWNISH